MRGYAAIGLDRPKTSWNVGSALRAAGEFGAAMVAISGRRLRPGRTDTMKAYKHLPTIYVDSVMDGVPLACIPVVVERHANSVALSGFTHPERAYYIFGPEDGSVLGSVVERARFIVQIDAGCLNLAAAVNVVLYDRIAKQVRRAG